MLRHVLVIGFLLSSNAVWAETPAISGQDDAGFLEARAAWLDGDDLTALRSLKSLAQDGNTAAQILLARIAEEPHMYRHVTKDMTRAERLDLLRLPGGLSGVSWLETAQMQSDLAKALVDSKANYTVAKRADGSDYSPEADAAVATLLSYGESDLATEIVFKLYDGFFLRQTLDLITRYEDGLDPIVAPIRLATTQSLATFDALDADGSVGNDLFTMFQSQRDALAPEVLLAGTHLAISKIGLDGEVQDFIKMNAEKVDAWTPLVALCESSCPTSYSSCLLAGATSMSAGRKFPFASPAQSLISTEDYWKSARIRGDAARRMFEVQPRFEIGASLDACFAETVTALAR